MVEIEGGLKGMIFECTSLRVSFRFLQRVQRSSPDGGVIRKGWLPTHRAQQPKSIAGVHGRTGRHRRGQTVDGSNGDTGVVEQRAIVELAVRADQRSRKRS